MNHTVLNVDLEENIKLILQYIGEIPEREGLIETPKRVIKMYDEIFKGYKEDPSSYLRKTFKEDHRELVLVKDISFYSHCEHHMVPFFGVAHIAYIPNGFVVGLSKIARMLEAYARRLQLQERLTFQVAKTMFEVLNPLGVMVVIEAEHFCMTMRGVQKPGAKTVTTETLGIFTEDNELVHKVLDLIKTK